MKRFPVRFLSRLTTAGAIATSMLLVLAGCGGSATKGNDGSLAPGATNGATSQASAPPAALKPVELTWYLPQSAVPKDVKTVEEAANKIIKEKINATVKLNVVAFSDYTQKMNVAVASAEKFDLLWTSNWNFDYVQNQSKGAFIPLDELIDKYAPDVKKSMPSFVWEATKIDGQTYGVPNYQTVTNKEGLYVQKRFIDKYQFDVSKIKKMTDIEPLLAKVKENEKDIIPWALSRNGRFREMSRTFNMEPIVANIANINLSNPDRVINPYETPEYKQYVETVRAWYQKGFINQDAATLKNVTDYMKAGKAAVDFHNVLKPGLEADLKTNSGGIDYAVVPITDVYVGTNTVITTMQAISRTSENPERAMMLINLVNTNKELFNLFAFGVEGKHYTKNADGSIKPNLEGGYTASDWVFGNVFNSYPLAGKDPKVAENTKKENESAKPSPIMGFKFKQDPVTAEIANITTVIDEYGPGLNTGSIDPNAKLAEFQDRLKKAGIDKVIAEVQKQLDEWKKTKK